MLKFYFKSARRVFTKNKHYFFFNLSNLTLGIVCGIIVLLYLHNFLSYDKHHVNYSRIYRVGYAFTTSTGSLMKVARSSEMIGNLFLDECPEVMSYVRFRPVERVVVKYDDKSFVEDDFLYADTSIFNVFTHEFVEGDASTSLEMKNSIVLVNSIAKKYFGDNSAIGKTIVLDSSIYKVTGVIKDLPENVHLKFTAILKFEPRGTQWLTANCYTYLLLNRNANVEGIYAKYPQLYERHISEQAQRVKANIDIILEPLAAIHYNSDLPQDFPQGNKMYIYIFAIVGLFMIVITSINYINMSTALSLSRTKEISIKKIFGADIKSLRVYFIFEAVLISFLAFSISLLIVRLTIDSELFSRILDVQLQFKLFGNFNLYLISLGLATIIGILSGIYPALHLSLFPPLVKSSSGLEHKKQSAILRKSLIVFQFVLSISVLIGVFAMNKQMKYVNSKDLGYNQENLLVIPIGNFDDSEISIIKEKLNGIPSIISTSTAYILPNTQEAMCNFRIETESGFEEQLFNWLIVGHDYLKTMEVQFVEGRDFDKNFVSDKNSAYIVNEAFIKHFSWEKAVGKRMQIINGGYFKWPEGKIVGVVKDFNISSLHKEIEPIVIVLAPGGYLHVRISGANIENTVEDIELVWAELSPDRAMDYSFMNEHLSDSYKTEINQFSLVKIFSLICVILSCLGLIGLSSYTIARRTKEVATRKIFGASIIQIILVLYKDIVVLILVAIFVAIPLSHWAVNLWLDSFAYHIKIGNLIFVISSLIAIVIGFISVLYHSLKVAYLNPVETLKCE